MDSNVIRLTRIKWTGSFISASQRVWQINVLFAMLGYTLFVFLLTEGAPLKKAIFIFVFRRQFWCNFRPHFETSF